jgi:hypothetical protein
VLILWWCLAAMSYQWLLGYKPQLHYDTVMQARSQQSSVVYFFMLMVVGFSFSALAYFSLAFYFSMVSNIPRVVCIVFDRFTLI